MRGHGDNAAQVALTPISVNIFSAIDGAGSMTDRTTQHDAPASHERPTSSFVSGPSSSSRFILCKHGGEMLSPEELPSFCERGKPVESMRLSSSGILAGDSTFIKISSNGSSLGNDADHCAMKSCHSSDAHRRTSSTVMEVEETPICGVSSDTGSADQMSSKKDLFDASLLTGDDSDLVTFQSTDTNMTTSLCSHEELHDFEDATEPENLYIVHSCREDHRRASFPLRALEEQLEDDIQRDIEDEISKEIQHLSQKLANLQARHGAQRMSDGSMPSVLSCPVTPVLTPRIRSLKKADLCSEQEECGRQKRGRVVAAKIFQGTGEKSHQSRGQGCAVRKESLDRRCSSSNSSARCAPSCENGEQCYGEESLAGTPSSGSIRSHVTDSTHDKPRARKLLAGVTSPQVFPDNNRRFEWVKTLRSGETGNIRSKQSPTPGKNTSGEDSACLDSVKKKRVALLADMTRMLETRLKELAVESAARNAGKVVASRYNQPRRELKRPEENGCLDKRTAVHLMKAGLTRGLAGKKSQDSYSESKVAKPERKAEKVPKKKSVGIQHDPSDQPSVAQTFETEYEAFVEGPSDGPKTLDAKGQGGPGKMAKISQGVSAEEEPRAVCKAVVGSRSTKRQPVKRTYIRCIEVVVDQSLADRSASGAIKILSASQPRIIPESIEGEGCLSPNLENAGATSNSNPHMTDASQMSAISLHEMVVKTEGSKSVKPRDQPLRSTVFKLHKNIRQELGCVQADMRPGSSDPKVPAAEKPPLSTLRERWEELIDALEKERLTLPKIRTETGNVVVTSPRDSGCVKRITERLKCMEQHFNLQDEEFTKSCVENEFSCKGTDTSATPTLRSLQGKRKGSAPQEQTKPARRHWKVRQTHEKFTPQSDVESFDLESFWCLVRESEDHVPTTSAHPPIGTVR